MSIPYFPSPATIFQNSSTPAFPVTNPHYNSQKLGSTNETMKHIVMVPQVTSSPSFTSQEFTTNSIPHESLLTSTSPSQTTTSAEFNNQEKSTLIFLPHSSYSKDHSNNSESTATKADEPNSKDAINYFTQFQTQVSPSSNSSTIPMFSVKNFPQMSPLAQPLGK